MSSAQEWMKAFRELHTRFRAGKLDEAERRDYFEAREQLARSLIAAQNLSVEPGKVARQSFRVAHSLQHDIQFAKGDVRVPTLDVCVGGLSTVVPQEPNEKEQPGFSLRLPGGVDPIIGRLKLMSVNKRLGNYRVSYSFVDMPEREAERLESVLFDLVLSRFP